MSQSTSEQRRFSWLLNKRPAEQSFATIDARFINLYKDSIDWLAEKRKKEKKKDRIWHAPRFPLIVSEWNSLLKKNGDKLVTFDDIYALMSALDKGLEISNEEVISIQTPAPFSSDIDSGEKFIAEIQNRSEEISLLLSSTKIGNASEYFSNLWSKYLYFEFESLRNPLFNIDDLILKGNPHVEGTVLFSTVEKELSKLK